MKVSLRKFLLLLSIVPSALALCLPAIANPTGVFYNAIPLTRGTSPCPVGTTSWNMAGSTTCISSSELNGYQGNTIYKTWWPAPQVYVPSKYGSNWVKSQDYNNPPPPPPPPPKQNTQSYGNNQSSDTIANTLCIITQALQGDIGKAIATIAIVVLGVGLFLGKISWPLAVATAIGIGMIFGAAELVQWLSSNSSQGC